MINLNVGTATRWGINAVILLGITLALYIGRDIFIPTIIALLLAAILGPLAGWMNQYGIPLPTFRRKESFPGFSFATFRWHVKWGVACLSVVLLFVVMIVLLVFAFALGLSKVIIDLSNETKQNELYKNFREKLVVLSPMDIQDDDEYLPRDPTKSKILDTIKGAFDPRAASFQNLLYTLLAAGGAFLWQSILVMFILLFVLLEGKMLSRRVVEIFGPHAAVQGKAVEALKEIASQVRAYLVWKTIINFAMALVLGIVYYMAGVKLAWTWALLTAILWYIPYLGPIVAPFPPTIDAFISCDTPWNAVFVLCFYTSWTVLSGYLVFPLVMGRNLEMNATTIMLACLFWERMWGPVGLFLAMPLMAAIKAVCNHVPDLKPWANLMSSNRLPQPPPLTDPSPNGETQQVAGVESHEHLPSRN